MADHPNRRWQCGAGCRAARECGWQAADESIERNAFVSADERAGLLPSGE